MNEEELKKGCGKEIEENDKEVITCGNSLSYNGKLPTGKWKKFKFRLCPTCKARLEGFQKGKLEQKKEGLFIMNGSNVDLRICETEAISEDEDEINQIGVIKSGCGLRVYPKDNSIYIEQLQKEIHSQTESGARISDKEVAQPYSKSDKTTKEIGEEKQDENS